MLLTITNTKAPATDLGYLLHKNPSRLQSFELSFGKAHVFYPEASARCCTAALLLDVDPVGLVRTRRGPAGEGGMLEQYVNDRPYVASSFMSVAIARVFNSALAGNSKDRPELVTVPLPLIAKVAALPCRGGEAFLRRLFEPLDYRVSAELGRHEEARTAIESLRKYTPTFLDLENVREDVRLWDPDKDDVERLLQGLQKAGLKYGSADSGSTEIVGGHRIE